MANEVQIFNNEEFGNVRVVELDNEPWFVGKDVADILGYSNTNKAIQVHVDSEDKFIRSDKGTEMGKLFSSLKEMQQELGRQDNWFINESGIYSLVFGSKLPTAKKFKKWVTSEVLPSIRKTGSYQKPMSQLEILQGSINKLVEQEREIARIKLTQQEQAETLQAVNERIDDLNGVCLKGSKRQRLVTLVATYVRKAGITYDRGWREFKNYYNTAFHTNLSLARRHYMEENNLKKKPSIPEFLEIKGHLDDAIRIADKMLSSLAA